MFLRDREIQEVSTRLSMFADVDDMEKLRAEMKNAAAKLEKIGDTIREDWSAFRRAFNEIDKQ